MLDLNDGMADYRVVSAQAVVRGESAPAEITINKQRIRCRVAKAPAVLTMIQECAAALPDVSSWHTEGDLCTVDPAWTMVCLSTGDAKCSTATYWATGNPRPLVERCVTPIKLAPRSGAKAGHLLLAHLSAKFESVPYSASDLPPTRWFRASWEELNEACDRWINAGGDLTGGYGGSHTLPRDDHDYVYLMKEAGSGWVKAGKCKGGITSPPARRRAMYQPGNRREITVAAQWIGPSGRAERSMIEALRRHCRRVGASHRAEWFEVGLATALSIVSPVLAELHCVGA